MYHHCPSWRKQVEENMATTIINQDKKGEHIINVFVDTANKIFYIFQGYKSIIKGNTDESSN